jgi:hypothetical protein
MSNEFAHFKHKITGEVVRLPAHYETLFPDVLEVTEEDVECTTCNVPEPPAEEPAPEAEPEKALEVEPVTITEPAKRTRRRANDDA